MTETPEVEGEIAPSEESPLLSNQTRMLFAMQKLRKHVYQGVNNYDRVLARRKANKVARAQRKINAKNK